MRPRSSRRRAVRDSQLRVPRKKQPRRREVRIPPLVAWGEVADVAVSAEALAAALTAARAALRL